MYRWLYHFILCLRTLTICVIIFLGSELKIINTCLSFFIFFKKRSYIYRLNSTFTRRILSRCLYIIYMICCNWWFIRIIWNKLNRSIFSFNESLKCLLFFLLNELNRCIRIINIGLYTFLYFFYKICITLFILILWIHLNLSWLLCRKKSLNLNLLFNRNYASLRIIFYLLLKWYLDLCICSLLQRTNLIF